MASVGTVLPIWTRQGEATLPMAPVHLGFRPGLLPLPHAPGCAHMAVSSRVLRGLGGWVREPLQTQPPEVPEDFRMSFPLSFKPAHFLLAPA